jgi:hypothetical protein
VIKFVSDLRQVSGFLWGTLVSSTNKTDDHNIAEILLKVALNTLILTLTPTIVIMEIRRTWGNNTTVVEECTETGLPFCKWYIPPK